MLFISSTLHILDFELQYHPLLGEVFLRFLIPEDCLQLFKDMTIQSFNDCSIFFNLQREKLFDSLNSSPTTINPVLDSILNNNNPPVSFLQNEELQVNSNSGYRCLSNKRLHEPMDMYDWMKPQIDQEWDIYISEDLLNLAHYPIYYPMYNTTWAGFTQSRLDYPEFPCTHYLIRCPNTHTIYWKFQVPLTKPVIYRTIFFQSLPGEISYSPYFNLNVSDPSWKL